MCSTADKFDFANPSTPLEKALVEVFTDKIIAQIYRHRYTPPKFEPKQPVGCKTGNSQQLSKAATLQAQQNLSILATIA